MKRFVLRYGLIGGLFCISCGILNWLFIARSFDPAVSQVIGYLAIIISLICVPLGIKYYRDKLNNGTISFSQGFKIGLGICFITSFVVLCYGILFFSIAGDDYEKWRTKGLSESELNVLRARVAQMPEFMLTPWFQGFILFLIVFLIGFIISIVSCFVMRRSKTI